MGADIHSVAEVQVDGKWRAIVGDVGIRQDADDRCYATFSVLAGVRELPGLPALAEPRGWPEGFAARLENGLRPERGGEVWLGDHSESWFLLSELLEFWASLPLRTGLRVGFLTREDYRALVVREEVPKEWSRTVTAGVRARDPRLDDSGADPYRILMDPDWTHIETAWEMPGRDWVPLLERMLEELQALAQEFQVGPDEVRLVFGFDS
jgi:hypothetical protein